MALAIDLKPGRAASLQLAPSWLQVGFLDIGRMGYISQVKISEALIYINGHTY